MCKPSDPTRTLQEFAGTLRGLKPADPTTITDRPASSNHWRTPDEVTPKLMLVRCRKCKHSEEWPFEARWMLRPREYRCS
jgi:hypothetical protein